MFFEKPTSPSLADGIASRQPTRRFDLTYFRNGMARRFPNHSVAEIEIVISEVLQSMMPSRDRARLKRLVLKRLSGESDSTE